MTQKVDARPRGLDLQYRPGTTRTLSMTWPAGYLAGRTFTSTLGGTPLALTIVGDTMTVVADDVVTAQHADDVATWLLLEDIDGTPEPQLIGRWGPSYRPGVEDTTGVVVVVAPSVAVAVDVAGPGPLSTALEALPAAAVPLSGTEVLPGLQAGVAVKLAAGDLAGGPVETQAGVSRDRYRRAEDFEALRTPVTVDATVVGDSKMQALLAGTGTQVSQGQDPLSSELGIADLTTGSTATGRAALAGAATPLLLFNNAALQRLGARVRMPAVSDGANTYEVRIGLVPLGPVAPADGLYFRSPAAAGNWRAVVRDDSADLANIDTGVPVDANFHVFVVEFDPVFSGFRWYIDGALVATDTVNEPDANAPLQHWGVGIFKSVGAAPRVLEVDFVSWDLSAGRQLYNMP